MIRHIIGFRRGPIDGGLDDRAQVLTGRKFVVVVFAMEVAS